MTEHAPIPEDVRNTLADLNALLPLIKEQIKEHHEDIRGLQRWRWLTVGGVMVITLFSGSAAVMLRETADEMRQTHDAVIHQQDGMANLDGRIALLEHRPRGVKRG